MLALVSIFSNRNRVTENGFWRITHGLSVEQVEAILGKPDTQISKLQGSRLHRDQWGKQQGDIMSWRRDHSQVFVFVNNEKVVGAALIRSLGWEDNADFEDCFPKNYLDWLFRFLF